MPPVCSLMIGMPPQTIILDPVQIVECLYRAAGADVVEVAVQESLMGLYRAPVLTGCSERKTRSSNPPHTIIFVPVHTADPHLLASSGAPDVEIADQVSVAGL